jgi:hypothetical protein
MSNGELFIGVATLLLAAATFLLAWQAKSQAGDAREAEKSRRAEVAMTGADPLSLWLDHPPTLMDAEAWPVLMLRIKNTGERFVSAITVTMHTEGVDFAQSSGRDALVPEQDIGFRVPLRHFCERDEDRRNLRPIKLTVFVDVESFGLLGQRVFQTFTCRLDRIIGDAPGIRWYQSRLQITPGKAGVHSTDVTFSAEEADAT